jgi:hypothetical protein
MQQLSFAAVPLRDKINTYLGRTYVRQIRFTLDRHSVPNFQGDDSEPPLPEPPKP